MTDCDSDMLMFYNVFFCSCLHPDWAGSGGRGRTRRILNTSHSYVTLIMRCEV